jgi:hypothetical protein
MAVRGIRVEHKAFDSGALRHAIAQVTSAPFSLIMQRQVHHDIVHCPS